MNDKEKIIAKLKEENEYLKSLLRMHNISFEKPKEIIQFGFPDNEKIKTYISYFVGRDDIFIIVPNLTLLKQWKENNHL